MAVVKYKAEFKDGSQYSLFGSDYFHDRGEFNLHHRSNLIGFNILVCKQERPISIFDYENQTKTLFDDDKSFEEWYLKNQSAVIDFGFGKIVTEKELYKEGLQRIKQIKDYIEEELKWHKKNKFSIWHVNGGYKHIEIEVEIALASIEKLKKDEFHFSNSSLATKLTECFTIPKTSLITDFDLLSYPKQHQEKIKADELIKLLKMNLELIRNKEFEIMSVEKIKNLRSWFKNLF